MQALFKTIYSSEIYYNFVCGNQKKSHTNLCRSITKILTWYECCQ